MLNIPIRNIYYMLSYAYQSLSIKDETMISHERFNKLADMYAEILILDIQNLLKRGLWKDYQQHSENASYIRGKIDITKTLNPQVRMNKQIAIDYEILTENNTLNQILKSTLLDLVYRNDIRLSQKERIKEILLYFSEIDTVMLNEPLFSSITLRQQNRHYQLAIDICHYLYLRSLLDQSGNDKKAKDIYDSQALSSLYERFVFNFYRKETNYHVSRPQIFWDTDDDYRTALPVMKTDIVLQKNDRTVIIDTKFYQQNMATSQFDGERKQLTSNLYQMFSYLENYKPSNSEAVEGILLYAKTYDDQQPHHNYSIKGKSLRILTLDLSKKFEEIRKQLIDITIK